MTQNEPVIQVGILSAEKIEFVFHGTFTDAAGNFFSGHQVALLVDDKVLFNHQISDEISFAPTTPDAFFELIATAMQKTNERYSEKKPERKPWISSYTGAKYVVENKLANNEKEKTRIMKTFDTIMSNTIISKEAKSKINEIIDKLMNCKP